jgi:hypothetical protein
MLWQQKNACLDLENEPPFLYNGYDSRCEEHRLQNKRKGGKRIWKCKKSELLFGNLKLFWQPCICKLNDIDFERI